MATSTTVTDSNTLWFKQPYGVVQGVDYGSFRDAAVYQLAECMANEGYSKSKIGNANSLLIQNETTKDKYPKMDADEYQYRSPSVSDSSVGGNDAMNPYPGFCVDDDIVHGVFKTSSGEVFGMGRCYSEMYDCHQQILHLTMGVAKYRNLQTYLQNATRKELSELNDDGRISTWTHLGNFLIGGLKLAITLPWLPIMWTCRMISGIKDYRVTEYFYFRDTMPLYYRYVNTLLSHIAISMGLWSEEASGGGLGANGPATPYGNQLPTIMTNGPDIYKIMCRRAQRIGASTKYESTDKMLESFTNSPAYNMPAPGEAANQDGNPSDGVKPVVGKVTGVQPGIAAKLWTGITTGALEGANFVGFRIDKADVANESFSNSTQDSVLQSKLNGEVSAARERNTGEMNGEGWLSNLRQIGAKLSGAKQFMSNLLTGDVNGTIAYLAAGNGYFDLPKQWGGSAGISRSLNFTMKLRAATGGDNVSIFQSIMVPLAMMLSAALPRAAGDSTYTSPFLVRAFCRGMFCVPAGIITTLSVSRGATEFGWSINRLPTVVELSFTLEDLSPMVFLGLTGTGGIFQQAFLNNTKMHEYLSTLTGIGLKERYYKLNQLKRRFKAMMLMQRNTTFSPTYWGYMMGDSSLVRTIMSMTPFSRVPNN